MVVSRDGGVLHIPVCKVYVVLERLQSSRVFCTDEYCMLQYSSATRLQCTGVVVVRFVRYEPHLSALVASADVDGYGARFYCVVPEKPLLEVLDDLVASRACKTQQRAHVTAAHHVSAAVHACCAVGLSR